MPIYEYRCADCDFIFFKRRSISEADCPIECERCHGRRVQRQLSRIAPVRRSSSDGSSSSAGCSGCTSKSCSTCGR